MKLYIGNKNYSSWSMRPWVLLRACNIAFEEVFVPFDGFESHHQFKKTMAAIHPSATVPVLAAEGLVIGDSLAIMDYLHEACPHAGVWPEDRHARAKARELAAIMHSGFGALRSYCPMNIGVDLAPTGQRLYDQHQALRDDIARLEDVLGPHISQGDFLAGAFSAADAFYAPVMSRIETYALPISDALAAYQALLLSHKAVKDWYYQAQAQAVFLAFEEPYRDAPS